MSAGLTRPSRRGEDHRDEHARSIRPRRRPTRQRDHGGPARQAGRRSRRHIRRHDPDSRPRAGGHDEGRYRSRSDEPSAIVAALSSGQVDGAGFWYPALATVKEQVPDLVEIAENADFEATVAFPTAFVAGNDVVANEPEKVDRVLKALREAMSFGTRTPTRPSHSPRRTTRSTPPMSRPMPPTTRSSASKNSTPSLKMAPSTRG